MLFRLQNLSIGYTFAKNPELCIPVELKPNLAYFVSEVAVILGFEIGLP
jgi:hypothetical protein